MAKARLWEYTDDERKQIVEAYDAAAGLAREAHESLVSELEEALRMERKNRSGLMMARALVVEGFLEGFGRDPRASELAQFTPGVRAAVVLGAFIKSKARQRGARMDGGEYDRTVRLCRTAVSAHARMLDRGLAKSARRTITTLLS